MVIRYLSEEVDILEFPDQFAPGKVLEILGNVTELTFKSQELAEAYTEGYFEGGGGGGFYDEEELSEIRDIAEKALNNKRELDFSDADSVIYIDRHNTPYYSVDFLNLTNNNEEVAKVVHKNCLNGRTPYEVLEELIDTEIVKETTSYTIN